MINKTIRKVLVTGATGFTGSHTVPYLLDAGYEVTCFVRPSSDRQYLPQSKIGFIQGNLDQPETLTSALDGQDALVNIASLGFGHAEGIVQAIENAKVKRAVFVSTTALFTQLNASTKVVRIAAEKTIQQSKLDYTIIRPTMIYGTSRDRNICRLIRYITKYPLLPIFGSGEYLLQPIYVDDVAQAITKSLSEQKAYRQSYNISGEKSLTYNQLVDIVCKHTNKNTFKLHIPYKPTVRILQILEQLINLPIKAEQIERLNENKDFSFADAARDFGFMPRTFASGLTLELAEMDIT